MYVFFIHSFTLQINLFLLKFPIILELGFVTVLFV